MTFRCPFVLLSASLVALISDGIPMSAQQSSPAPSISAVPSHGGAEQRAVLDRYCVTSHNARSKNGGLALDSADVSRPSAAAGIWEKVIRKVSTDQMPPPGRPAPDKRQKDALVSWLVSEIDHDATAHPNPGRTE